MQSIAGNPVKMSAVNAKRRESAAGSRNESEQQREVKEIQKSAE